MGPDPSAQPKDHGSVLKVVKESDAGIYLTGMKGIATAAAFADEVIVGTIEPLAEGDRSLAFTVVVNISTPGLRILSRQVYAGDVSHRDDAPLSSRYDENDAILSFKDVFVPWDRVLTYRDQRTTFGMWWETPAYPYMAHQAAVRFYTKLEFLAGLAVLGAQSSQAFAQPSVRLEIGRLFGYVEMARAMALGSEAIATAGGERGHVLVPDKNLLFSQRQLASELYPKFLHTIRMQFGGSLVMIPAHLGDLEHPVIASDISAMFSTVLQDASERVRMFKLAWDATSSDFASRHAHYEQFYQGAPYVYLNQILSPDLIESYASFAETALALKGDK